MRSKQYIASHFRGALLSLLVACAAAFIAEHYTVPAMLIALLAGMALNQISEIPVLNKGIALSSTFFLRVGIGFMGAGLSVGQLETLGITPVIGVLCITALSVIIGLSLTRIFGGTNAFGILASGAVAICGASAALAISTAIPKSAKSERNTLFVIATVTALSTIAMIVYPIIFSTLKLTELQIGFLLGATIHDVAQVVGAGYSVSDNTGLIATFIKMLRISLLPFIVIGTAAAFQNENTRHTRFPMIPWFLLLFTILFLLNALEFIPRVITDILMISGKMLLLAAIAAIGMKVNLREMVKIHPNAFFLVLANSAIIVGMALIFVLLFWSPNAA